MNKIDWGIRILIFISLLYIGSGAYTQWELVNLSHDPIPVETANSPVNVGGEIFADEFSATIAILEKDRDTFYRWTVLLAPWQTVGLIATACGGCGGFLREVMVSIQHPKQKRLNWMYLGLLMGPAILLGLTSIGEILFEGGKLKIGSAISLTFLAGCFSEESFDFLQRVYSQMREALLKSS